MFVETSEKLVARRQTLNTFFLSINALILTLGGVVVRYLNSLSDPTHIKSTIFLLFGSGIIFCIIWLMQINSIKQLNEAKFRVIHLLEENLPASVFKAEWNVLGEGKDSTKYTVFTRPTQYVPIAFIVLHFVFAVILFPFK